MGPGGGGDRGDDGEPLGVNAQVSVIDVGGVNKQGTEHPPPGDGRIFCKARFDKSVGNGNLELNGVALIFVISTIQSSPVAGALATT